ncbi:hypothetical protein PR048_022138 [Dryococelus australis]|uniref:HAT C-terminal dimerisation domain-containing protein n=1 Tax=Dryococelus australis TaxID=614101 RepID=A0ABQ9H067_9NEOP|nr:hypothetical protein PR048_022138 [Dryococelus australis]
MGTKELYRLLSLKNDVLKDIDIFDPAKKQSGEWVKVQTLAKAFPNVIANNEYDELNSEFVVYTLWDPPAELSIAMKHDPDTNWHKLSVCEIGGKQCFTVLCKLAKALLILPHSNTEVERIFSNLNLIKTAHRSCLESPMLNVLLHISSRKNMAEFQSTEEMRKRAKNLKK